MHGKATEKGNVVNIEDLGDQLAVIGLALFTTLIAVSSVDAAQAESNTDTKQDVAVIDIPHPREGNLLMLRGLAGNGTATFRVNRTCHTMPVRFVAGDFSGQRIDVGRTGSIRIVITAPKVMRDLLAGRDLVSDRVRVTSNSADKATDLFLARGLSADTGFVINPGRNLMADILGAGTTLVDCATLTTTLP